MILGEMRYDDQSNRVGVDKSNIEDEGYEMLMKYHRLQIEIHWDEGPPRQGR